jgi:hypothetical protein
VCERETGIRGERERVIERKTEKRRERGERKRVCESEKE